MVTVPLSLSSTGVRTENSSTGVRKENSSTGVRTENSSTGVRTENNGGREIQQSEEKSKIKQK